MLTCRVLGVAFVGLASAVSPAQSSPISTAEATGLWGQIQADFAGKRQHLLALDIAYVLRQEFSGDDPALNRDIVPVMHRRVLADIVLNRFLVREEATTRDGGVNLSVFAWDGAHETRFIPLQEIGMFAETPSAPGLSSLLPMLSAAMLLPGVEGGRGVDDGALHHLLPPDRLSDVKISWIRTEEPRLLRVTGPRSGPPQAEIDIDIDRIMVVALRFYNPPMARESGAGQPAREIVVESSQQFEAPGGSRLWLPTRIRTIAFVRGGRTVQTVDVDVSSVKIGEGEPAFGWVVPFPAGTRLVDRDTGQGSRRDTGIELGEAELDWVTKLVSKPVMSFVDGRREGVSAGGTAALPAAQSSYRSTMFVLIAALVLAGAGLAAWCCRHVWWRLEEKQ